MVVGERRLVLHEVAHDRVARRRGPLPAGASEPVIAANTSTATPRMPASIGWKGAATPSRICGPLIHADLPAQTSCPAEAGSRSTYDAPAASAPASNDSLRRVAIFEAAASWAG